MKLEELRSDDLGRISAWLPRDGQDPSLRVAITYPDYCTKAFYYTCQALEQLERSKTHINQGNTCVVAVGMWYIGIEAFINALLRIACRIVREDFAIHKGRDIGTRIDALTDTLGLKRESLWTSGVLQRFEEFKTFRNEIFHDRTWEAELVFHKTRFSPVPYLANQIDAVQSAIIALEICSAFRHVYRGLDLMPDIVVQKDDSFSYKKLDVLYSTVMRPLLVEAMRKHSLSSDLVLDPTIQEVGPTAISSEGEIAIIGKVVQDDRFKVRVNPKKTNIGARLFYEMRKTIVLDTKRQFGTPSYHRR